MSVATESTVAFGDFDPNALIAQLSSADEIEPGHLPNESGVYAVYIRRDSFADLLSAGPGDVLYVGQSRNLAERDHVTHRHSGFSTLRRSIGAVFLEKWEGRALRRAPGASETNWRNFRFDDVTEARLTDWIRQNLLFRYVRCPIERLSVVEKCAITALEPLMNINGWRNPRGGDLKSARRKCAEMARLRAP